MKSHTKSGNTAVFTERYLPGSEILQSYTISVSLIGFYSRLKSWFPGPHSLCIVGRSMQWISVRRGSESHVSRCKRAGIFPGIVTCTKPSSPRKQRVSSNIAQKELLLGVNKPKNQEQSVTRRRRNWAINCSKNGETFRMWIKSRGLRELMNFPYSDSLGHFYCTALNDHTETGVVYAKKCFYFQ